MRSSQVTTDNSASKDDNEVAKTEVPIEDTLKEQPPCIVKNPEEVYLSQDENLLSHKEILKKGAMMPIQSMEGAGEVDRGFNMSVQGRYGEERKNPHRRMIDCNIENWKEDLLKLRFLWRGKTEVDQLEWGPGYIFRSAPNCYGIFHGEAEQGQTFSGR
ncbi:unnamed protein product [Orchesella dallaii]|uniref:Uncharacterized protein n=1 Tax=Orchesella dallaii TaxID=48710 RepID=A0ABP1RVX8_9HEXA